MRPACEFIEAALANRGNVLVHSELGKSRSAAIVAAYSQFYSPRWVIEPKFSYKPFLAVMRKYRIGAGEACAIVRDGKTLLAGAFLIG